MENAVFSINCVGKSGYLGSGKIAQWLRALAARIEVMPPPPNVVGTYFWPM